MAGPTPYIRKYSQKYGLDPRAVMAVAAGEGGLRWGAVGDQGSSFGPFQLHIGGASPYKDPRRAASFANSPAGVEYALRKMAGAGARGLTGQAAVNAIIRNFERPADPNKSVAAALGRLGSMGTGGPGGAAGGGNVPLGPPQPGLGDPMAARRQFTMAMIGQIGKKPDASALTNLIQQQAANVLPSGPPAPEGDAGYPAGGGGSLQGFLKGIGLTDAITSGYRPGAVTSRGTPSFHGIKGKAFDLNQRDPQFGSLVNYVKRNPSQFTEFFYDPLGWFVKRGKIYKGSIGGHSDHAHIAR